ncbi:hypothetical protein [Pantoea ananatis]|uniref:hypothetical protein n=1 Tax=Pantoea ananas TaxID=553 RepID=UPI0032EEF0BB
MIDVGVLYDSLVKVKSKLTGSGVWINLGFDDHSYVLTAKHNIHNDSLVVFNHKGEELESSYIGPLDGLDISLIKIHCKCDNKIGLCLDDFIDLKSNSKHWILGYPKSLVKISDYKAIDHEGTILIIHDEIFFRIEKDLPDFSERENIDGFSGGPIFEMNSQGIIYLKGIITDSFDDNFSYKRIRGEKLSSIYRNLPCNIKDEILSSAYMSKYIERAPLLLSEDIDEVILEGNILTSLKSIDINELNQCKYFYLPDDRPKITQHISLLTNYNSIKSYLNSRIISILVDERNERINSNPTVFDNGKIFTIHVTEFTNTHVLIAKLIKQDNSIEYSDALILIIYPSEHNDLTYVRKKKISRIISNYSEGNEPELYSRNIPPENRRIIKNFLEARKQAGVTFSILNLEFLTSMIISEIENEFDRRELNPDVIKSQIIKVIRSYD